MAIPASDVHSMLAAEAIEVLDKMREGQDLLRNNTNSFLSGGLHFFINKKGIFLIVISGLMSATLAPSVRISVGGNSNAPAPADGSAPAVPVSGSTAHLRSGRGRHRVLPPTDREKEKETAVVNPMSVSVPNLSAENANIESTASAGLLETFAAIARRRAFGGKFLQKQFVMIFCLFQTVPVAAAAGNENQAVISSNSNNASGHGASLLSRAPSSVSSLVRLALSSNFPGTSCFRHILLSDNFYY